MGRVTATTDVKLIAIGNSRGIRLPKVLLRKYGWSDSLVLHPHLHVAPVVAEPAPSALCGQGCGNRRGPDPHDRQTTAATQARPPVRGARGPTPAHHYRNVRGMTSEEPRFTDADGNERWARIAAVTGRSWLVVYRPAGSP